ncbi:MAG TPA: ABC transporter substrate-binding protein [Gaiellaceae bacterium]|nr:ABC transporter substrate-binding protein [Gaiellaceae bacterium]
MAAVGSRRRGALKGAAAVALMVLCLAAAGCGGGGSSSGSSGSSTTASGTPQQGGTAYFAEGAQAVPNFIFPFMSLAFFSVTNGPQFQQLMYRPLLWFGKGTSPALNPALSLATPPKYSNGNRTVTMTMKPYKFSNGETVTAQDVVFWMNILKVEYTNWAAYAAGGMPDDVKDVTAKGNTITMTLTGPTNPYWFTYNEVSQITPFPMAWDISKTGQKAGGEACGHATYASVTTTKSTSKSGTTVTPTSAAAKSCVAVYTYLSRQSGYDPANPKKTNNSLKTYATNPLWQVVDGPWHLTKFTTNGLAEFKPNPTYSGPVKPKLAAFVELPYTSTGAEFNALVGGKIDVGYLPSEDVTSPARSPLEAGANNPRLSGFALEAWYPWGINYFPYNFNSTGDGGNAGKIFKQLYFRQAFQLLVDQPLYLKKIFKNYGVPTYGPVPVLPKNSFATAEEQSNPYAYNVQKATSLLTSHGWKVVKNGVSTCSDAAKCGVPAGAKLDFTLQYVNNGPAEQQLMQAQVASWAQAGIKISLTTATFDTVIGNATPCPGGCSWELENWGGGWVFSPDYYPSGEELFQTGAGSNSGSYSDKTNDANIKATNFGNATLATYENYLAKNLPVVWQPNQAFQITEARKTLQGVFPQNPLLSINPENWYFTK